MNLLHLTSSRFFGGPERQMLELAKAMGSTAKTTFASFAEGGLCQTFLNLARDEGFEALHLRHDTPRLWAAAGELACELRRRRTDVLMVQGYKADLVGLLAARRLGIPIVSVSRGWTGECARVRLYEALDRRLLRWMDKVVCVSHGQADKVRRAGVPQSKIEVIHNAIQPERFTAPTAEVRNQLLATFPTPPKLLIGAAGRLSPEKGFDLLIDAAAEVLRSPLALPGRGGEGAADVGFVLFGDGVLRPKLEQQIAAAGLTGRFNLAGFRSDLDSLLPNLDVFVQSSFTEGLPNVVLEAMAAGVPVVATSVGGTPEIIDHGVHGLLVPPGDGAALAQAMARLLADPPLRAALTAAAQARVAADFTFAAQAAAYNRVFQSKMCVNHCFGSMVAFEEVAK